MKISVACLFRKTPREGDLLRRFGGNLRRHEEKVRKSFRRGKRFAPFRKRITCGGRSLNGVAKEYIEQFDVTFERQEVSITEKTVIYKTSLSY